jgi:transposase
LTRVSENTLRSYLRQFQEGGVERLKRLDFAKPTSEMAEHREALEEHFRKNPPRSTGQAAADIERITGIRRGLTQVRKFLTGMGLRCRKLGMIPAKADADEQREFLGERLRPRPRLRQAQRLRRVVCFVDAAHFVHGPYLGYLWCFVRLVIRGPSGRKRFNVLGAIDAVTHELTTVCNDTVINAEAVCELLRALAARYVGLPLTLVLDNARYQRCAVVQRLAKELRIELLFLPAYSPNLNLIERLWKFVKKEVLSCRYDEDFARFKGAIVECLDGVEGKHTLSIKSLPLQPQEFDPPVSGPPRLGVRLPGRPVPPHVVVHQRRRPRQPQVRLGQRRRQQPHRPVQRQLRYFFWSRVRASVTNRCASPTRVM